MASIPALNPNEPERNRKAGPRNRAVTDPYEPGSTMKVFSVAAALDAGAVKPQDRVDCERGRFEVGAYTIHDTHPHGVLSVSEVIQKSSNIGAAKIARKLGKEALEGALRRMGFGKPTGIELPGERGGTVRPAARWGEIGLANVAFGQGITATPLQVTSALGAVGNGGWLTRPFILRRVQDAKGNVLYEAKPEGRQVLSQRAAAEMTEMLALVTQEGGTATAAAVPGYGVAGKTGTAQKVDSLTGRYSSDKWVSSFVGFVPASAPRLAIMVVVDEPQGQHYGGLVAAPIFKRVAVEALRYLGVPPDQEAAGTAVARGGGAEAAGSAGLAAGGKGGMADGGKVGAGMGALPAAAIFKARGGQTVGTDTENVPGEAEGVRGGADSLGGRAERLAGAMASVPGESAAAARPSEQRSDGDSAVVDQPEEAVADGWGGGGVAAGGGAGGPGTAGVTGTVWAAGTAVPDFTGMSMGEAVAAARRAGVRLEVWGSGRATSQSPGPGPARSRTRCRVSFSPPG
jgi:membrane peptidoglycan carboxypeptidase